MTTCVTQRLILFKTTHGAEHRRDKSGGEERRVSHLNTCDINLPSITPQTGFLSYTLPSMVSRGSSRFVVRSAEYTCTHKSSADCLCRVQMYAIPANERTTLRKDATYFCSDPKERKMDFVFSLSLILSIEKKYFLTELLE